MKGGAQTSYETTLEKIDTRHQDCLENGEDMTACSDRYYKAVDSMLNVVYNAALKDLPASGKTALRNEQREWLANRTARFREIETAAKKDGEGSMERNIIIEDKAAHVRERLDEMIGKLQ